VRRRSCSGCSTFAIRRAPRQRSRCCATRVRLTRAAWSQLPEGHPSALPLLSQGTGVTLIGTDEAKTARNGLRLAPRKFRIHRAVSVQVVDVVDERARRCDG
jgi:hypothetical protein